MARSSQSGVGGLIGLIVAAAFVVAIVAAPLYTRAMRSPEQKLQAAVSDDVEAIRRIVLNVDQSIAAMRDMRTLVGKDQTVDPQSAADLLSAHPNLLEASKADLEPINAAIQRAQREDDRRGTKIGEAKAGPATASVQALKDVETKIIPSAEKMLADANQIANRVKSVQVGDASARNDLNVNRVLALLKLTEGRVSANRSAVNRDYAAAMRTVARDHLGSVLDANGAAERVEFENPAPTVEGYEKQITSIESSLKALEQAISQTRAVISQLEKNVADLKRAASESERRLAALEQNGFTPTHPAAAGTEFEPYRQQYIALTTAQRQAEAAAAAIENGTLANAELSPEADDDLLNGAYTSDQPQVGLRDIREHLAELEEVRDSQKKAKEALVATREQFEKTGTDLAAKKSELDALKTGRAEAVTASLETSSKYLEEAEKASQSALKALNEAAAYAAAALTGVTDRRRRATEAVGDHTGGPIEHPFQRIAGDKDVEASLNLLAGQIAYEIALVNRDQIEGRSAQHRLVDAVAKATGSESTSIDMEALDKLREQATASLTKSVASFEKAASLIKGARISAGGNTFQGDQYVWQVQVGEAAAHILQAELSEDAGAATEQRHKAYDLLVQAVQGREQSPMLSTAVDTLLYMQNPNSPK